MTQCEARLFTSAGTFPPVCSIGCGLVQLLNHFPLAKIAFQNKIEVLSLNYAIAQSSCFSLLNSGIVGIGLKCFNLILVLPSRVLFKWDISISDGNSIYMEESNYLVYSVSFIYILSYC